MFTNAIRTDLRLLLECLKYQMKCPASQKQALLTIASVCQHNEGQNVEFLRQIGGVTFIYNLSKASRSSEVKETALFTLSSLAEVNESCRQSLCREEMFCGLADCMEQDESLTLKRVSVYMLCVLVSNNKLGQSLAKTSRCIDVLLNLFRSVYHMAEKTNELLQLWTSVSSALCGCVNNPQNEENQHACVCVLPVVKVWLQQVSVLKVELAQPICSFISMTVANNSCVQKYFASVGGLLTVSVSLSNAVTQCRENPAACMIAVMLTRTLSACISDNEDLAPVLSELTLVPDLLLLLSSPNLSPQDQLAVVLTLGHCTDACVGHQSQLLDAGGLPVMISLLTDSNEEEVRRAATFVLQTCKNLTGPVVGHSVESDLQRHRQSAWEIWQKIQQLERQQLGDLGKGAEQSSAQPMECRGELWEESVVRRARGRSRTYEEKLGRASISQNTPLTQPPAQPVTIHRIKTQEPEQHVRRQIIKDFDKTVNPFQKEIRKQQQLIGNETESSGAEKDEQQTRREREIKTKETEEIERDGTGGINYNRDRSTCDLGNENPANATNTKLLIKGRDAHSPDIFKHPAPMKRRQQTLFHSEDELSVCSELLDSEIERILTTPAALKPSELRCAGCVSGVDEVNSRSLGKLLRSCKSQCDFHLVLQKADDRLKRSLYMDDIRLRHRHDHTSSDMDNRPVSSLQKPEHSEQSSSDMHRNRKDYSRDELMYLTEGVRRFGHSWNTILWAYPFEQGRTNVDLAKKYRKLQQSLMSASDHITEKSAELTVH